MALIWEINKKDWIRHYAAHFKLTTKEVEEMVEKNPQILEDYAEYVMNRGY